MPLSKFNTYGLYAQSESTITNNNQIQSKQQMQRTGNCGGGGGKSTLQNYKTIEGVMMLCVELFLLFLLMCIG